MKKTTSNRLSKILGISKSRAIEAIMKAQIITAIQKEVNVQEMTQVQLAQATGIPRTAITGILSGSLQKVTIDRLLRLLEALNLTAEIRIRKAA